MKTITKMWPESLWTWPTLQAVLPTKVETSTQLTGRQKWSQLHHQGEFPCQYYTKMSAHDGDHDSTSIVNVPFQSPLVWAYGFADIFCCCSLYVWCGPCHNVWEQRVTAWWACIPCYHCESYYAQYSNLNSLWSLIYSTTHQNVTESTCTTHSVCCRDWLPCEQVARSDLSLDSKIALCFLWRQG